MKNKLMIGKIIMVVFIFLYCFLPILDEDINILPDTYFFDLPGAFFYLFTFISTCRVVPIMMQFLLSIILSSFAILFVNFLTGAYITPKRNNSKK